MAFILQALLVIAAAVATVAVERLWKAVSGRQRHRRIRKVLLDEAMANFETLGTLLQQIWRPAVLPGEDWTLMTPLKLEGWRSLRAEFVRSSQDTDEALVFARFFDAVSNAALSGQDKRFASPDRIVLKPTGLDNAKWLGTDYTPSLAGALMTAFEAGRALFEKHGTPVQIEKVRVIEDKRLNGFATELVTP